MKNKNFGVEGNGQMCSCGRHEGVGTWLPAERYTQYRRTIQRMGKYAPRHMKQYVWDWVQHHSKKETANIQGIHNE